jgi:hypothetical protein
MAELASENDPIHDRALEILWQRWKPDAGSNARIDASGVVFAPAELKASIPEFARLFDAAIRHVRRTQRRHG